MAAYQSFHVKAGPAIRSGDALLPAAAAVRISGGPDAPTSPTARSPRARKSPAVITCSRPKTSTMRWNWPAAFRPPATRRDRGPADLPHRRHRVVAVGCRVAGAAAGAAGEGQYPGHTGVAGRSGTARRIRRRGRRSRRRGRGSARAGDGDHGTRPRRPGVAHRRAVRGSAEIATGFYLLAARPRRGGEAGIDDSRFDRRGAPAGQGVGRLIHEWQPGRRLSARVGAGRGRAGPMVG